MRTNTINLQVVVNLGNYESLRVGAEFTPDSTQTLDQAMIEADKMIRDSVRAILDARTAPATSQTRTEEQARALLPDPKEAERKAKEEAAAKAKLAAELEAKKKAEQEAAERKAAEEAEQEAAAENAAHEAEAREAEAQIEDDNLDAMNVQTLNDQREFLTFDSPKLQKVLRRIESGVEPSTVLKHFRFDPNALAAVRMAYTVNPQTNKNSK